jgi:hypothetical protein
MASASIEAPGLPLSVPSCCAERNCKLAVEDQAPSALRLCEGRSTFSSIPHEIHGKACRLSLSISDFSK